MHFKAMIVLVFVLIFSVLPTTADQDQFEKVFRDMGNEIRNFNRNGDEEEQDFDKYRQVQEATFQAFRDERDRNFCAFLKAEWEAFAEMKALERYTIPKPKIIPKASEMPDDDSIIPRGKHVKPIEPSPMPSSEAVPQTAMVPSPKSEAHTELRPQLNRTLVEVMFYGRPVKIAYDPALTATVADQTNNHSISTYWATLSQANFETLIRHLGQIKGRLLLNDWGFFHFVESFVHTIQPDTNSATLLTWFLLTKSGYRAKVGYSRNRIYLLVPVQGTIYETPYYTLNGTRFYNISYLRNQRKPGNIYTYKKNYPGAEHVLNLVLRTTPRTHAGKNVKKLNFYYNGQTYSVPAAFNPNTVRFYHAYPQTNWEVYLAAPIAPETEASLVSALGKLVEGKSETETVNMLLRFVQTAFEYKTDDDQFGREKYMFAEETLSFPYSDCEDRATLFSSLVRRILDLDVIGLHYPEHVATAIKFSEYVAGDAVTVSGDRFVICDPTYINANIGMTMPQFKTVKPQVIRGAL
jgi:hypothetical protein